MTPTPVLLEGALSAQGRVLWGNKQSYALYEELKHLRVAPVAGTPYIYKRLDTQVHLPVEERA
jgi:hypothetical protein